MGKLYKTIDEKALLKRVDELKQKQESGEELGKLFKLEIAIEDNISTKGIKTEVGSKMLKNYIPPFDAEVVDRLLNEDAIIKGKIDTREFGVGEKIDSNMGKVVSQKEAHASIGIDTSGEIRSIASKANLYGFKPTYGNVSRYGIIGSAPSLEQVGIISSDLEIVKDVFYSISGKDKKDSTSLERQEREVPEMKDLKIGVLKEHIDIQDEEIKKEIEKDLEKFKENGMSVEYISIPSIKHASSIYKILQSAEFSSDMGKFDGLVYGYRVREYKDTEDFYRKNRSEGFSEEVKKRIMLGNFILSEGNYKEYYEKSQKIRTLIVKEVKEVFKDFHIILNPIVGEDMQYTVLANIVGSPAISLASVENKGYSLQIMGESFSEELLFKFSKIYQEKILNIKEGK